MQVLSQNKILNTINFPKEFMLRDHNYGFDVEYKNKNLDHIQNILQSNNQTATIWWHEYVTNQVKEKYKNINLRFDVQEQERFHFCHFHDYTTHPDVKHKNFLCSFNGSDHVGRQLLASILGNSGYFDPGYCSKNFSYNNNWITGHLENLELKQSEIQLYEKFFINDDKFNQSIFSFGHIQYQHDKNIYNLEHKLTQSFVHIVSETLATSYYPYVTEKFLYSVVTRGLFLAYAQPGWHKHIEKYYGFKLYNKIFDYSFDSIQNPVKRLVKLIEMISKFSKLSANDWRDLYLIEQDTIEYNYEHYFSSKYQKHLAKFE